MLKITKIEGSKLIFTQILNNEIIGIFYIINVQVLWISSGQKGQIISILYVTNNLNELLFKLMKNIGSAQGLVDHCEPILVPPMVQNPPPVDVVFQFTKPLFLLPCFNPILSSLLFKATQTR